MLKSLWKLFLIAACLMVLAACFGKNDDSTSKDENAATETENQEDENNVSEEEDTLDKNQEDQQESEEKEEDATDETDSSHQDDADDPNQSDEIVAENEAFQVYEPAPDAKIKDKMIVRGLARVFEGTVQYEFEDGHFIFDKGFTTASMGAPEWGAFTIEIDLTDVPSGKSHLILFEESAKDGSMVNQLVIPVYVE